MSILNIEALSNKSSYIKQPTDYKYLPTIPNRIALLAQSNSGKTVLIINMLKKVYLDLYDDVLIISHSINLDPAWNELRGSSAKSNKFIQDENMMDEYDSEKLKEFIDRHIKIRELQKKEHKRRLGQVLVILDDIIDNREVVHSSSDSILNTLFIRGRHSGISVWFSSQKFKLSIPRIVRLNCSHYIIFRLGQKSERDDVLAEFSALVDMNTLLDIYTDATSEPYSFLYIDRTKHNLNEIFHKKFNQVYNIV